MRRRKKIGQILFLALFFWFLLFFFTFKFSPEESVKIYNLPFGFAQGWQFSTLYFFFPLVFLAVFFLVALLLKNTRWGLWGGLGITVFLILRFLKLTHPFYLLILLFTLIALEVAFRKS